MHRQKGVNAKCEDLCVVYKHPQEHLLRKRDLVDKSTRPADVKQALSRLVQWVHL